MGGRNFLTNLQKILKKFWVPKTPQNIILKTSNPSEASFIHCNNKVFEKHFKKQLIYTKSSVKNKVTIWNGYKFWKNIKKSFRQIFKKHFMQANPNLTTGSLGEGSSKSTLLLDLMFSNPHMRLRKKQVKTISIS